MVVSGIVLAPHRHGYPTRERRPVTVGALTHRYYPVVTSSGGMRSVKCWA